MKGILFFLTIMVLIFSCGPKNTADIELNNGVKWKVNEEMKPHIDQGYSLLIDYMESEHTNFQELASDLKNQNDKLIQSCNMKGKSHDELHKWLHPHMTLIKDLSKVDNLSEARPIIDKIDKSFKTYKTYFE